MLFLQFHFICCRRQALKGQFEIKTPEDDAKMQKRAQRFQGNGAKARLGQKIYPITVCLQNLVIDMAGRKLLCRDLLKLS